MIDITENIMKYYEETFQQNAPIPLIIPYGAGRNALIYAPSGVLLI